MASDALLDAWLRERIGVRVARAPRALRWCDVWAKRHLDDAWKALDVEHKRILWDGNDSRQWMACLGRRACSAKLGAPSLEQLPMTAADRVSRLCNSSRR